MEFCNRALCASGIQLDVGANRLVGAQVDAEMIQSNVVDIFLLWIL